MVERQTSPQRRGETIVQQQIRKSNYVYLFVGLSLLLLVGPALDQFLPPEASAAINASCLSGALLLGIWSFVQSRIAFRVGLALAIGLTVLSVIDVLFHTGGIRLITLNVLMAFLLLSIWHAGRDVLFGGEVDLNRLIGAMCIYEMIGLVWAVMYAGVVGFSPEAFAGDGLTAAASFWDFVYYSFVTLTTLGYGDVIPHGAFAKSLAYMEAVIGQLYIAVLIASLIGSHLASRKSA